MTKILCIDDEIHVVLEGYQNGLSEFGFSVVGMSESSADLVLKRIANVKPDIVMLDIDFKGVLLGKPLLRAIKQKFPEMPVVMVTATMHDSRYKAVDYKEAFSKYSKDNHTGSRDYSALADALRKAMETPEDRRRKLLESGFVVGKSEAMQRLVEVVFKIADSDMTVLIGGETGTGKEMVAKLLHGLGERKAGPFVACNCAAFPTDLLESELFGHTKGAFTGAGKKDGLFKAADNGTIFLDEVGELPLNHQAKLLRTLQEKTIRPMGSTEEIAVDVRVVAATNRNLKEMVKKGEFREDLYHRFNKIPVRVPSLRERIEDIEELFLFFVEKARKENPSCGVRPILSPELRDEFKNYFWPGNLREFQNQIDRAVKLTRDSRLEVDDFDDLFKPDSKGSAQEASPGKDVLPEEHPSLDEKKLEEAEDFLNKWDPVAKNLVRYTNKAIGEVLGMTGANFGQHVDRRDGEFRYLLKANPDKWLHARKLDKLQGLIRF
jgi:DNA-binding NtrC family response regulator